MGPDGIVGEHSHSILSPIDSATRRDRRHSDWIANTLLSLVGLAPTSEPIHVMGVAVMGMGMLFMAAARVEVPAFIRATVWIRVFALVAMATLVLARVAPPVVLLFGFVDAAAAAWTYISLRQELNVDPSLSRETV